MPATTATEIQMNQTHNGAVNSFLEDLKQRTYNGEAAKKVRQIAAENRAGFDLPNLKAFVQSTPSLNSLRYASTDDEE